MNKTGRIVFGVVIALALLLGGIWLGYAGAFGYGTWNMMGGRHMMDGSWGFPMMGFAGGLGMLLFWALVIAGIVWLVQATRNQQRPGGPRPADGTPLDVLKRRYAAGEITKEQFDEMKQNLAL